MVHPKDPVAVEDFDASEEYLKLLLELGVLVGVPCEQSVSMNDMGHQDDLDKHMDKLESMMTEAVKCMEAVARGGRNDNSESDKKRRALESIELLDDSTALRSCKRQKTEVARLDAHRGESTNVST